METIKTQENHKQEGTPKKRQVSLACSNCRASKTACTDERPCKRCVKKGIGKTCVDAPKKKRMGKSTQQRHGNVPILPNTHPLESGEYIQPLFKPQDVNCPQIFLPDTPNLPYLPEEYNGYPTTPPSSNMVDEPPNLNCVSPSTFEDLWSSFVSEVIESDKTNNNNTD